MTSLGSALIGDEKKAYDYAYLSCIDLKKQKCLRKGPTDEEANRKWSNIVIDLFKYQTDLDQQLLSDRTFYVNCGSANALAGSLIAVALAIYAITFWRTRALTGKGGSSVKKDVWSQSSHSRL